MDEEKTIEQERDEYLAGWKRALADYDNLKKDLASEKEHSRDIIRESVALSLLPVLDSFDQVNRHAPTLGLSEEDQKKFDGWRQGIGHVQSQLEQIVRDLGLEEVATIGAFNPEEHEGVGEREGGEEGTIAEVTQKGWKLNGKVIRPSKVIINK